MISSPMSRSLQIIDISVFILVTGAFFWAFDRDRGVLMLLFGILAIETLVSMVLNWRHESKKRRRWTGGIAFLVIGLGVGPALFIRDIGSDAASGIQIAVDAIIILIFVGLGILLVRDAWRPDRTTRNSSSHEN